MGHREILMLNTAVVAIGAWGRCFMIIEGVDLAVVEASSRSYQDQKTLVGRCQRKLLP